MVGILTALTFAEAMDGPDPTQEEKLSTGYLDASEIYQVELLAAKALRAGEQAPRSKCCSSLLFLFLCFSSSVFSILSSVPPFLVSATIYNFS